MSTDGLLAYCRAGFEPELAAELTERAAAAGFAIGQAHDFGQPECKRQAVQAVFAHEVGTHARQVAFVAARESVIEQARDGQAQHRVTQELEPLVVVGAMAAVGQRPLKQRDGSKTVSQALLQRQQIGIQKLCIPFRPALTSSGRNNA